MRLALLIGFILIASPAVARAKWYDIKAATGLTCIKCQYESNGFRFKRIWDKDGNVWYDSERDGPAQFQVTEWKSEFMKAWDKPMTNCTVTGDSVNCVEW